MKHHVPDIIKKNAFTCFTSLNQAERAVVLLGDDVYRESLDPVSYTHLRAHET